MSESFANVFDVGGECMLLDEMCSGDWHVAISFEQSQTGGVKCPPLSRHKFNIYPNTSSLNDLSFPLFYS